MIPLAVFGRALFSRAGLTVALCAGLALGFYSWHRAEMRALHTKVEAETRTNVQNEAAEQHARDTEQYKLRITELEAQIVNLAKSRAASTQRIEVITKEAEAKREEIQNLGNDDVRRAIREHLSRPDPGPTLDR